jgi:aspartate racemase
MYSHRVVGVIGGMGPEATVELMRRVVARTPAIDDQDHVHLIIDNNPKIPSRIAHLMDRTGIDPTDELIRMAQNLERAGADALAMPCNTAHAYAFEIQRAVSIPLLNMVELTVEELTRNGESPRVGLLASTAVHNAGVYERALTARGLLPVVPSPSRQDELMVLIRGVKRGESGPAARQHLAHIALELADATDVLLVACSELSVISTEIELTAPLVDSLEVLTLAIVKFANTQGAGIRERALP